MFDSILQTKLYMPPLRDNWVTRPRLLARLEFQRACKLILISAPAGYGKTTFATAWLQHLKATTNTHICWLSLNEADSDPQQFFRYLTAALQSLPNVQTQLSQILQASQQLSVNTLINALIHDVTAVSVPFILILDDYHLLDSADIDHALATLLDHMPPHMTLALTSRSDPGFPLSRLRARGQLIELRADDLRFTDTETADFLQQTMGVQLTPDQIVALEYRTEGWIAGLQMAALSLQNRSGRDRDTFVQTFTGSHRFIIDYLAEEAFTQQPPPIRDFLLATAILEQLSGSLCDAVTGRSDSQTILEQLDHQNLFLIPLDDERHWYRYHHLFADVLQTYGRTQYPDQLATWHQRAADWLAAHGNAPDAIRHALIAQDYERAAGQMELIRHELEGTYQVTMWLNWAAQLPEETFHQRPVFCTDYAWALLENGLLAECETHLAQAEHLLTHDAADLIITNEDQWRVLPAAITAARTYLALAQGDIPTAVTYAQQTLDFFTEDEEHQWKLVANSLLAVMHWQNGDLAAAIEAFTRTTQTFLKEGKLIDTISTVYVTAEMEIDRGRLRQAAKIIDDIFQLVTDIKDTVPLGTSDLYRLLAHLAWEHNDLDTAETYIQTAAQLDERAALTNWPYRLRVTQAQIKHSQGGSAAALALLDEAERHRTENPLPIVRPTAALKAAIWLTQNDLDSAESWAQTHGLSAADDLHYLREFEYITFARLLITRYRIKGDDADLQQAFHLLERLHHAAEASGRTRSLLEILILTALAHATQNDLAAALIPLKQALTLAEPERFVQLFASEGEPLNPLLQAALGEKITPSYTSYLLKVISANAALQPLIDPLSDRELEILTLIAAGLKNQEIADQLFISLNTVLYHNKNIYGKLGVSKRTQAIAKARELNLF